MCRVGSQREPALGMAHLDTPADSRLPFRYINPSSYNVLPGYRTPRLSIKHRGRHKQLLCDIWPLQDDDSVLTRFCSRGLYSATQLRLSSCPMTSAQQHFNIYVEGLLFFLKNLQSSASEMP